MPLMRFNKEDVKKDYAAAAGWTSDAVDISKVEFTGVYIKVSAATTISLLVETTQGYITYDTMVFAAAGENWWNIWRFPFENIKFKTSAAITLTIQVMYKT